MKIILDLDNCWNNIHGKDLSYYASYKKGMPGSWLYHFIELTKSLLVEVILAEAYLAKKEFSKQDVIISERRTVNTPALLLTDECPLVIYTGEPPNVDWKFYSNVYKNTKPYKHAFLFSGSQEYISKKVQFHRHYWPNDERNVPIENSLTSNHHLRKRLVMVSGNNGHRMVLALKLFKLILR